MGGSRGQRPLGRLQTKLLRNCFEIATKLLLIFYGGVQGATPPWSSANEIATKLQRNCFEIADHLFLDQNDCRFQ